LFRVWLPGHLDARLQLAEGNCAKEELLGRSGGNPRDYGYVRSWATHFRYHVGVEKVQFELGAIRALTGYAGANDRAAEPEVRPRTEVRAQAADPSGSVARLAPIGAIALRGPGRRPRPPAS